MPAYLLLFSFSILSSACFEHQSLNLLVQTFYRVPHGRSRHQWFHWNVHRDCFRVGGSWKIIQYTDWKTGLWFMDYWIVMQQLRSHSNKSILEHTEWQVKNEVSILPRFHAPSQGNSFPVFRDKVVVLSSRVRTSKNYGLNQCISKSWHYSNSETQPTYVWQWLKKQMMVRRSCLYPYWAATLHHVVTPLHFVRSV